MKMRKTMLLFAAAALLAIPVVGSAKEESKKGDKLDGIMCPVSGHDIDPDSTLDHNGGKVYLCCDHCLDAWNKDMGDDGKKKFLAKANYQLVATGQAKQKKCPMSGGKVKDGTEITVGDNEVEIGFCCKKCTKKANDAEGDDLLAMLFGEKAFAKAFTVGDEDKKKNKK